MSTETIRVWDRGVRIFHWSLVGFFTLAYLTGEDEGELHAYAGYVVIGLILFRILWGIVGTRHARFADFVYPFSRVRDYLKSLFAGKPVHYLGHNPAGGWMIIALLVAVLLTALSGLELYGIEGHGPLAGNGSDIGMLSSTAWADEDEDDEREHAGRARGEAREHGEDPREEFWEEVHEFFANLTLLLILVHVAGVVYSSYAHRENLVKAMITGYKPRQPESR